MTKPNSAMRKARTHFEQVPLAVVKRIAEADVFKAENAAPENRVGEPAPGKTWPRSAPPRSLLRKRR